MIILNHPPAYKVGTRVLMLKGRHKDGMHDQRTVLRVSHSPDEFDNWLSELHSIAQDGERIYATAGARDVERAIRLFKERQLDADYDRDTPHFYRHLNSRWCSCLMAPKAQAEKLWLFDCDSVAEIDHVRDELKAHYTHPSIKPYWYWSKAGCHCIVAPFNRSLISLEAQGHLVTNPVMLWMY